MFSTARKIGVFSLILAVINMVGLIMVTLYFIDQGMAFFSLFAWLIYLFTISVMGFMLTIAIRSFVENSEAEAGSNALRIKQLNERISELESKLK